MTDAYEALPDRPTDRPLSVLTAAVSCCSVSDFDRARQRQAPQAMRAENLQPLPTF